MLIVNCYRLYDYSITSPLLQWRQLRTWASSSTSTGTRLTSSTSPSPTGSSPSSAAARRRRRPDSNSVLTDFVWLISLLMDGFGGGMYGPAAAPATPAMVEKEYDESLSELYAYTSQSRYADSSSPDVVNLCSTAVASAAAAASSKNIAMERDRRKRLNEKLFALRAVVPKITKV